MTSYIASTDGRKKKILLSHREWDLRYAIQQDKSHQRLSKLAEKVRQAHLRLIKARRHHAKTYRAEDEPPSQMLDNLEDQEQYWRNVDAEEIIALYRPE